MAQPKFTGYVQLMRPWQWMKNSFVAFPALLGGVALTMELLFRIAIVFFTFCLISSAIYCINDVYDSKSDSRHPVKRLRPVASGEISKSAAISFAVFLIFISILSLFIISDALLYIIFLAYVVINIAYTLCLKRIALVDISVIAIGFMLRLYAGGVASGCHLSGWLVIVTFMLSLFLALGKRRADAVFNENAKVLYSTRFIDVAMAMTGAAVVAAYFVYAIVPGSTRIVTSEFFYLTGLPVVIGLLRYMQLCVDFNRGGDHSSLIVKDPTLRWSIIVYILMFIAFRLWIM